jgi:hypothetical protein
MVVREVGGSWRRREREWWCRRVKEAPKPTGDSGGGELS